MAACVHVHGMQSSCNRGCRRTDDHERREHEKKGAVRTMVSLVLLSHAHPSPVFFFFFFLCCPPCGPLLSLLPSSSASHLSLSSLAVFSLLASRCFSSLLLAPSLTPSRCSSRQLVVVCPVLLCAWLDPFPSPFRRLSCPTPPRSQPWLRFFRFPSEASSSPRSRSRFHPFFFSSLRRRLSLPLLFLPPSSQSVYHIFPRLIGLLLLLIPSTCRTRTGSHSY